MTLRRLTHVVESLEPWGTQQLLSLVVRRLPPADYLLRIVALRAECEGSVSCRAELQAAGCEVSTLGRRDPDDDSFLRTTWKLRPYLARDASDLVHLWDDASIVAAAPWIARPNVGPAVVCSIRNPRRELPWLMSRLERRTLFGSLPVVSDVRVYRQRLEPLGMRAEAAVVVPRDPIESHATRTIEEVRTALGVPPSTKLIGTACRLTPDANVRDLLFAGALLKLVHADFRIVVCGNGPSLDDLRRFAALMRIDDLTIFTGLTLEPDDVISSLFAYVAPSYWAGPAREVGVALKHGVPVVAADTPIHRAEFDVDRSGFVFREHDQGTLTRHLHELLTDAEFYGTMSAAAREYAQAFPAADEVASLYAEHYAAAIAGKPDANAFRLMRQSL